MSVNLNDTKFEGDSCNFPDNPRPQMVNPQSTTQLYFTYSVEWKKSEVSWASRWDIYLGMNDVQIHWFSIINSLVVVFFLSGIKRTNKFYYINNCKNNFFFYFK